MTRIVTVGAAQLGPIARDEPRAAVVGRMITLMAREAWLPTSSPIRSWR